MSAPGTPGDGHEIDPGEVLAVAGRVDALAQGVTEAQEALRLLAAEPLAVGTGGDNAAIAAWYRELVDGDTVPAAAALVAELDAVRASLRADAQGWDRLDRDDAGGFDAANGGGDG